MEIKGTKLDFELMVGSAVRYALGRRTYIVSSTCDFVEANKRELEDNTIRVIIEDISKCDNLGDSCDIARWMQLLNSLHEEQTRRMNSKK